MASDRGSHRVNAVAVLLALLPAACQDGLNVGAQDADPPINVEPVDTGRAGSAPDDASPEQQRPEPTDVSAPTDGPNVDARDGAAYDAGNGTGGDVAGDGPHALQWKPSQVNFGQVAVGTSSPIQSIQMTNTGRTGLRQLSVATSGAEFQLVIMPMVAGDPQCHGMTELAAGARCVAFFRFLPQARLPTDRTASATFTTAGVTATVGMVATVVAPDRIVLQWSTPILRDTDAHIPVPDSIRVINDGGSPTGTLVVQAHGLTLVSHDCGPPLPVEKGYFVRVDHSGQTRGTGLLVVTTSLGDTPRCRSRHPRWYAREP